MFIAEEKEYYDDSSKETTNNLGGCEECFNETLSKIQSEWKNISKEISKNIKNIKDQEQHLKKM